MLRKTTRIAKAKIAANKPKRTKTKKNDASSDDSEEEVQASTTKALEVE